MEPQLNHDFFLHTPPALKTILSDFDKETSVVICMIAFFAVVYSIIGALWFKFFPEPKPIEKF